MHLFLVCNILRARGLVSALFLVMSACGHESSDAKVSTVAGSKRLPKEMTLQCTYSGAPADVGTAVQIRKSRPYWTKWKRDCPIFQRKSCYITSAEVWQNGKRLAWDVNFFYTPENDSYSIDIFWGDAKKVQALFPIVNAATSKLTGTSYVTIVGGPERKIFNIIGSCTGVPK